MRLKQVVDNGNVVAIYPRGSEYFNVDNRIWIQNYSDIGDINSNNQSDTSQYNSNYERCNTKSIYSADTTANVNAVCNRQYRINSEHNGSFNFHSEITQTSNLEGTVLTQLAAGESFLGTIDAPFSQSPLEDERGFELSDTDEMSETSCHPVDPVPRGIVNPNYPGFQHLAHTLADYSTNYHSENDMTDDDVDIPDISEYTYTQKELIDTKNLNNNILSEPIFSQNHVIPNTLDIPDLLKSVSVNSNNNIISPQYKASYPDADVENNFDTKDIIGNFNKEIEDEIRQLLNYNINIQSDLEELRKDIEVNLAKPIENTINNISEVVNHVIKKLVETHCDICERNGHTHNHKYDTTNETDKEHVGDVNENKSNTRTEMIKMNLTRPTFLLIENDKDIAPDAFLSDGTEEININDDKFNPQILIEDVEKTVQKLNAELRQSLQKLDESFEHEHNVEEMEVVAVVTDGNSNEITHPVDELKRYGATDALIKIVAPINEQVVASFPDTEKNNSSFRNNELKNGGNPASDFRGLHNSSLRITESVRENNLESFDVYNIETALPKLDFDAIESHLKAAKEAERRKHNDREEIRRRLATGVDSEEYHSLGHSDRPGRKPSLHSRLKSGKNLEICYLNEDASDNESQTSEVDKDLTSSKSLSRSNIFTKNNFNHPYQTRPLSVDITKDKLNTVQSGLKLRAPLISKSKSRSSQSLSHVEPRESDFHTLQATLQTEARIALAQAKEMARVQIERERRSLAVSPVTEMLRRSMEKAHAPLAADRRRVSRQLLTDMNVAQLQVIVNELHTQIEWLNESLVRLLMARDELHMGQDSMLVDIEDLTRYLGVKEQTKKTKGSKAGMKRLTSFVHK